MLKSLVDYYEYLIRDGNGTVAPYGWSTEKVSALAVIDDDGQLLEIIPSEEKSGWLKQIPQRAKRSSGVKANLLCDNSSYMFGIDNKGKPDRAIQCYEATKELNIGFLHRVDSDCARAFEKFFLTWDPTCAEEHPSIAMNQEVIAKGGNIAFCFKKPSNSILDDPAIREAVSSYASFDNTDSAEKGLCLVTGKRAPIARLHPPIKGVIGAQSSGASLVSFNAPAFESYGHDGEQGLNAPVSEYAAFAYGAALNYLLSDKLHHMRIGDTTIVYWALEDDTKATALFGGALNASFDIESSSDLFDNDEDESIWGSENPDENRILNTVMQKIHSGKMIEGINLNVPFCILGLDPSAARLAVRFFMRDTLGTFLTNIEKHYERLRIAHPDYQKEYLSPWQLVSAVQNPNSKKNTAANILGGALLRSILGDTPYPAALYENAILRTRATQNNDEKNIRKINYARVSILKAYLLKNKNYRKEDLTVDLNKENTSVPYLLGRLFSVVEETQEAAAKVDNRTLNTTIVDRYFNSACATPSVVFPEIMKLNIKHLGKLKHSWPGFAVTREKEIGEITTALHNITPSYPARLTIEEQGDFIIGYWCQHHTRFSKPNKENDQVEEA